MWAYVGAWETVNEAELVALLPYLLLVGGAILIAVGAYGWYCQKKKIELMKLEGKIQ